jgi:branched-chain amino acid transport system substrate-binding protein
MRKTLVLSLLALTALTAASCGKKRDDSVIRFGEFGSLSGAEATFGLSTHEGILLAVEEANAAGGIGGKQVQVVTADDQGKTGEAEVAVTKLVTQDRVHLVLGEVASSRSLAGAPICQKHKVPMVSPSSTNPKVTQVGDYIFRVCFIDPFQGRVMADFSLGTLKAKTAAVIRDQKSDYSMGLADFFVKRFAERGGKIVAEQSYVGGDIDFKSQLTALRATKPDVVFVPGYYTEVALLVKQARDLGLVVPFLGGDGWESTKLFEIGGKALDGCYFSTHFATDSGDPKGKAFLEKYRSKWGHAPDALAVLGYDAALVALDAVKRSKSLDGPDLRDAIAATKDFPGVSGRISLDAERNAVKSAVVLKIAGGEASYLATVNP